MKILIIIPPFATLPVIGQGGTERIAEGTINELLKRGHDVTLIGCGDCQTKAKFVQIFSKTISEQKFDPAFVESSRPLRIETAYISKVMRYLIDHHGEYDFVINNLRGGYLLLPLTPFLKNPILSVQHLPLFEEVIQVLEQYSDPNIITISNSQRKPAGDRVNFLATVYNGLNLDEFQFDPEPDQYALFMGAMGEHKSPHLAIEACRKVGIKLVLVGGKKREPYFSDKIRPYIDNEKVVYAGEVVGQERIDLLKKAKVFLMPITWEEPFGLAAIEAMACGTPVVAFDHGAMREIITDGTDGYIAVDVDQMAAKIKEIDQIDRKEPRRKVEGKFTYEKMVDGYLEAYKKVKK